LKIRRYSLLDLFEKREFAGQILLPLAWFFVHLFYLTGFGNKVMVFTKLAWCYVFSKRGARVMMNEGWRSDAPSSAQETIQRSSS
jgi:hypothetical protein